MSIVNISEVKKNYDEELVKSLETLVQWAKDGVMSDFVCVYVLPGHGSGNICAAYHNPVKIIGEMRVLERDLIDCHIDTRMHAASEEY